MIDHSFPLQRVSLTSVDLTTLGEAHGMIVDLLADPSLPQSVTSALKVISDMLSPLLQQSFNRNSFSTSLVTVLEKTQVHADEASVKDQPDLKDDTPMSLKNVSFNLHDKFILLIPILCRGSLFNAG